MNRIFRKIHLLLCFLIVYFNAFTQNDKSVAKITSLKKSLQIAKEDTNKVDILNYLSNSYSISYADTGAAYAQQALYLAEKLNYKRGIYKAEFNSTVSLMNLGNYPLALDHAFRFLSLANQAKDTFNLGYTNSLIGSCYYNLEEYNNSLAYWLEDLKLCETSHSERIPFAWCNMAREYQILNRPDSAMLYALKAYQIMKDDDDLSIFISGILGDAYVGKADYDSALLHYRMGVTASQKNHAEVFLIDNYNGIAKLYKTVNNTDSAAWYAKKVLAENIEKSYPIGLLKAANMLADIYESRNKADSTLKYLRIAINIKDSLFSHEKIMSVQNLSFKEEEKQKEIKASELKYQNRLRIYLLLGGLITLLIIAGILQKNNRNKQKAYALLQNQKQETDKQKEKVETALSVLKSTQAQLIQSEKMASLGGLTAGIAHEIQNPLNFVNNFSEVNKELIEELKIKNEELKIEDKEVKEILNDIKANEEKINYHGKRADAIVKGMLQHSRSSVGTKEPTDINALCDKYLRLSYHGMRSKDSAFNAALETNFDNTIGKIDLIPQDIGRVLLNLYNNAFYAVKEKQASDVKYEALVAVSTKKTGNSVRITVSDNGNGISSSIVDKIFQPFFTTKPTGQGTGLGLSLSYDIVKAHGGEIKVESKEGEGTAFVITLPA